MSTTSLEGKRLEGMLLQSQFKLYGPKTLRVLEEIGHATPRNPQTLVFYSANNQSSEFVEQERISPKKFKKRL